MKIENSKLPKKKMSDFKVESLGKNYADKIFGGNPDVIVIDDNEVM